MGGGVEKGGDTVNRNRRAFGLLKIEGEGRDKLQELWEQTMPRRR